MTGDFSISSIQGSDAGFEKTQGIESIFSNEVDGLKSFL